MSSDDIVNGKRPAMVDLVVDGVTFRRNLFGEWCQVSDEVRLAARPESSCLNEIVRLRAVVERLCAAGDALAVRHRKTFGLDGAFDTELRQWEAARRER